jgi:fluoride ion exporter CrcB/FEX
METLQLFRLGQLNIVLLNILAQNIFGISMAALGFFATRSIIR